MALNQSINQSWKPSLCYLLQYLSIFAHGLLPGFSSQVPLSKEIIVVDAILDFHVLSLAKLRSAGIILAALNDLHQKVTIFLLHSPFAVIVPLVLVDTFAAFWAAYISPERIVTLGLVVSGKNCGPLGVT